MWNNHGWGLREMLFLSAIILICLIVVALLINNLYSGFTSNSGTKNYEQIELNLKNSAKSYYKKHKSEIGNLILSDFLIEEKYISEKSLTFNGDVCSGYVVVEKDTFTPFITCQKYETVGY